MANYHSKRIGKLQKRLKRAGLPAVVVTNEFNVTYLTGFTGDSSYLLVTPKTSLLISDTRYTTQIAEECPEIPVSIRDAKHTKMGWLAANLKKSKLNQIAIEADSLTKSTFDQLDSELDCELVSTSGWCEELRAIKDKFEIAAIRKSIEVNERAFEVVRAQLSGEQTERQIAHNLEHQIRAFGGDKCAFPPIVGVGPRAALPHGKPSYAQVHESSFVLIDWGSNVDSYLSDITRVLVTGKVTDKFRKVYNVVLQAQKKAIRKIKPGMDIQTLDQVARGHIEDAGYKKYFGHGLGHSFGLQIHETPFLSPIQKGTLEPGMVVTIEPGIYLPGSIGVRIEDDILVTRDGHENMTSLPKELDECVVSLL